MTNYEYLIDKYPNLVKRMIARYIGNTVLCFDDLCDRFSDCSDCPFNDDIVRLNSCSEQDVSDWLEEERKDD